MFILGFICGAVAMTAVTVVLFTRAERKSKERFEKTLDKLINGDVPPSGRTIPMPKCKPPREIERDEE